MGSVFSFLQVRKQQFSEATAPTAGSSVTGSRTSQTWESPKAFSLGSPFTPPWWKVSPSMQAFISHLGELWLSEHSFLLAKEKQLWEHLKQQDPTYACTCQENWTEGLLHAEVQGPWPRLHALRQALPLTLLSQVDGDSDVPQNSRFK